MSLTSILRHIIFYRYDYESIDIDNSAIEFVVIHIPDQIGDAMAIYPIIRSLELHQLKHLLIVSSTINKPVFESLNLGHTKLTIISMTMQDYASKDEIQEVAKNIKAQYGTPDICIEAMRKKNRKTMLFISKLRAKTNFQVVGLTMKCYSPICKTASRTDQELRAPVTMTWSTLMRDAGFPAVRPMFEFPLNEEVLIEVRNETRSLEDYIAINLEGSVQERTFSLPIAKKLISLIKNETDIPIVIVHGPKGVDNAVKLTESFEGVYHLSLSPSLMRSAAVIKDAFLAITPDTSILHMASAYNTPAIAVYADYKTRWPAMQDISETIVVGKGIDHINLDEFKKTLRNIISRINNQISSRR